MRKKYKYKNNTILFKITLVLVTVSILITLCFYKMRPVILRYAVSVAETIMLDAANNAVLKVLDEDNISYNDIVILSKNDNGFITSIETDIIKINNLKSRISNRITEIIDEKEFYGINIPLGTFFSNIYTSGYGPKMHFNMHLTATAVVTFKHEFISAGINQVLHRVEVNMDISGGLVISGFEDKICVSTSAIAAQTVIVGAVPDAFTEVIETGGSGIGGVINDYGAKTENILNGEMYEY